MAWRTSLSLRTDWSRCSKFWSSRSALTRVEISMVNWSGIFYVDKKLLNLRWERYGEVWRKPPSPGSGLRSAVFSRIVLKKSLSIHLLYYLSVVDWLQIWICYICNASSIRAELVVDWLQIWICYIKLAARRIRRIVVDWLQIWICYIQERLLQPSCKLWIDCKSEFVTLQRE